MLLDRSKGLFLDAREYDAKADKAVQLELE
jgi:hypothetical protein